MNRGTIIMMTITPGMPSTILLIGYNVDGSPKRGAIHPPANQVIKRDSNNPNNTIQNIPSEVFINNIRIDNPNTASSSIISCRMGTGGIPVRSILTIGVTSPTISTYGRDKKKGLAANGQNMGKNTFPNPTI